MSREIKFRAWDKLNEKLVTVERYENDGVHQYVYVNLDQRSEATVLRETDFELMQYTGLKDKNGVEIYEGDIIEYGPLPKPQRWEVKWVGSGLVAWHGDQDWFLLDARMTQLEVIGNIYENPELLTEAA